MSTVHRMRLLFQSVISYVISELGPCYLELGRAILFNPVFRRIGSGVAHLLRAGLKRRLACLALVTYLFVLPVPTSLLGSFAGQAVSALSRAISVVGDALTWPSRSASLIVEKALAGKEKALAPKQLTTIPDRIAAVSRIAIGPSKYVLYLDVPFGFTATGYDSTGQVVQGVPFSWSVSDPSTVTIDPSSGRVKPIKPGLVWVTSQTGSVRAMAPLLIRPGNKPLQTDAEFLADQAALHDDGSVTLSGGGGLAGLLDQLAPTVHAQNGGGDYGFDQLFSVNGNLVGGPRSVMMHQTALGPCLPESANYELAIPVVSLGGRGISTGLGLYLNSQTWAAQGGAMYFNAVRGWPSPGFSLGMGRVVVYGSSPNYSLILIDPDGTRHQLAFVSSGVYATTDGTHITGNINPAAGGTLYYPDGTSVTLGSVGGSLVPSGITDTNSNQVTISYGGGNSTFGLSSIHDTKNRVISFVYNSNGYLTSVTGPGPNGATITLMQFDYTDVALNFNFTSGFVALNVSQGQVVHSLKHVYNPWTNTGYLFTYSGYGVITTVSKRRQMSVDGSGNISDGVESANATFAYPAGGAAVAGIPGFGTWTETPGSSNAFAYTAYTNLMGPNSITYRIIPPDYQNNLSSYPISWLTRSSDSTSPGNGHLTRVDIQDAYGNEYRKILYNYALDPGGSPQIQSITTYDDTNTPIMVNFDYDQYGNVTNRREFGYQVSGVFVVRRRTRTSYVTDPNYIGAHIVNLPGEVDVYDALLNNNDADDVLIAKKTFAYDQYGSGMVQYPTGVVQNPGFRGNLTGTTTWTDLTANTSITRTANYDMYGSIVSQTVGCCQQKSYTFGSGDYYTNPTQLTSGAGPTVTDTVGWDFNTDSPTSYATPANVTVNTQYDNAFRPTSMTWNPSGSKTFAYNDAAMSASVTVNTGNGSGQWSGNFDGWGRAIKSVDQGGGQVFSTYDVFSRLTSGTNPLAPGITSGPTTTYQFDPLGRVVTTTLPDGNTLTTTYSGSTVTVTDQVGRKVQRQFDGLGRLIAVTEQDPGSGSLTQTTNYTYDLLNNLTQVNQGGQIRSWKYDAAGRMLYENIPEQTATINDGTGTMWTCKWTYNDFGLVVTKTDARGVVTSYGYSGLNKVTSINYNTSSAPSVAVTLAVAISYDSAGRIQAGSIGIPPCPPPPNNCSGSGSDFYYAESYTYDASGNPGLTTLTRTIDTLNPANGTLIAGQSYTTTYANDSFRKPKSITYPSGRMISYNHESNTLRLASITEQNGPTYLNNISYNPAGQAWQYYLGNGVIDGFIYDNAAPGQTGNRLQVTQMVATSPGGAPGNLMTLNYSYQASAGQLGTGTTAGNTGRLMSVSGTINGQTESAAYTYDLDRRLITSSQTSSGSSAQRRFAYDRWGNRTGVWDAVSGGNQLQSLALQQSGGAPTNRIQSVTGNGAGTYSYDSAGNVTNDGVHSYAYDAENRLVSVDAGATAKYYYDFSNRRVKKVTATGTTHYVWEGGKVLSEHDGNNGSVSVDYIYSGSALIAKVASGVTNYFVSDRLSVRMILDTSGNLAGRQAHLPFGEDFAESGSQEKHHFTTYERDAESGMDYAVNREYSQPLGRFGRVDPVRGSKTNPQSLNRYAYCLGDPVNSADPLGHDGGSSGPSGPGWVPSNNPNNPGCFYNLETNTIWCPAASPPYSTLNPSYPPWIPTPNFAPPQIPGSQYAREAEEATKQSALRQGFKDFLKNMSQECQTALSSYIGSLRSHLVNLNLVNLQYVGAQARAIDFVGSLAADRRQLLSDWFASTHHDAEEVHNAPVSGIYFNGYSTFDGDGMYLFLHEMAHVATGKSDQDLAADLGITKGTNEDWSDAVSRFFNSKCTEKSPPKTP